MWKERCVEWLKPEVHDFSPKSTGLSFTTRNMHGTIAAQRILHILHLVR